MTQAIQKAQTKQPATLRGWLENDAFKAQIAKALPRHLSPDRFIRVALTTMTRIPKLAGCDQASFFNALLTLSQLGLEPDGRRAHLIPFENRKRGVTECQLIIDYKGLVELIMRSGAVLGIHADVVCDNDEFIYDRGEVVKHVINFREPRGQVYAAYATCTLKDGGRLSDAMSRDDIERIRQRSRAANSGPWVTDWNEMAKKTVFRRLSKWLPLSSEYRDAVEADDAIEVHATASNSAPFEMPEYAEEINDAEPETTPAPEPEKPKTSSKTANINDLV